MDVADFISKDFTYAIIGASNNQEKYGYKVTKDLKEAGYVVVPVNPKGGELFGLRTVTGLAAIDRHVDVVVFVVPPSVTVSVLHEVLALGITKVWMQPGSESQEAIAFCEQHGIDCVHDMCIMVQRS